MEMAAGQLPTLDARVLDRALRKTLWPALLAHGFRYRTNRVAWRYAGDDIDVVELQAVGQAAEATGCTSLSLSMFVSSYPRFVAGRDQVPARDGRPRPHYWHCHPFYRTMIKTLSQPWFRPFSAPLDRRMQRSFRLHREALSKLIDRSVHDVPDIWFMRDDGSNLIENVNDMTSVVLTSGLDLLDRFHDPRDALRLIDSGSLLNPDSPHADDLRVAINAYLAVQS
jgi:hypothetical protein